MIFYLKKENMFFIQNIFDIINTESKGRNIVKLIGKCDNNCYSPNDDILHVCKNCSLLRERTISKLFPCNKMLCSKCIKNDNTICVICSEEKEKVCKYCKSENIKHFMCSYCGKIRYVCLSCTRRQIMSSVSGSKYPEIIISCMSKKCDEKMIEYIKKIRGY